MGSRTRDFVGMLDATQGPSRARQSPSPADDDDHPDGVAGSDVDDDDDDDGDFAAPAASGSRQALKDKMPGVNGGVLGGARPVPPEYGQIRWPARPKAGPREQVAAVTDIYGRRKFETVGAAAADCSYWAVQWRKPQTKKHKTWDGDAYLKVDQGKVFMMDEDGKCMAQTRLVGSDLVPGATMRIGAFDTEVDRAITLGEFRQYTSVLNKNGAPAAAYAKTVTATPTFVTPFKRLPVTGAPRMTGGVRLLPRTSTPGTPAPAAVPPSEAQDGSGQPAVSIKPIKAAHFYAPKTTMTGKAIAIGRDNAKSREKFGGAAFDPAAEGAVVMARPTEKILKAMKATGDDIVDVVLDPLIAVKMRDHQKEGVKFMYRCVMGFTGANAQGCILADEMGLGKTLQTIALIYTLSRQSPFPSQTSIIQKALIVCPVTLVKNWRNEFRKWVGDRIGVCAVEGTDDLKLHAFLHTRSSNVLVIGYERLRKIINQLKTCQPPIGLIVCDEGHRLKSKDSKTTKMFDELNTARRIILSGTPVQNDLEEYWSMVDFCCPNLLGRYSAFARQYEKPIMKSRTPGCSTAQLEDGQMRAKELSELSKEFIIRRTAAVLENYLPPKYEYVVFVAPTEIQLEAFRKLLQPNLVSSVLNGDKALQLGLIDPLRKVASSPMMAKMRDEDSKSESSSRNREAIISCIPSGMDKFSPAASGKLIALDRMLVKFNLLDPPEKVVIVSSYVTTLNLIQGMCEQRKYPLLRLDGSTPAKQRQELVNNFNRSSKRESFIFLLSAKAGGTGINLIGASRLILFDSDWNPSTDLQAMARIHRDGQKKSVFIYRLLTTNSIDEKIYQRQITKTGLSDQMLDHGPSKGDSKDSFSMAELRDIFAVNLATDGCQTHDLLGCDCLERKAASAATTRESSPEKPYPLDDDDEEEESRGFMTASQYDPEPTPKMRQKMAAEQQQRLAALKAWTHVDAFDKASFTGLQDNVLYDILWKDWDDGARALPVSAASTVKKRRVDEDDEDTNIDEDDDGEFDLTSARPARRVAVEPDDEDAVDGRHAAVIDLDDEDEGNDAEDDEDDDAEFNAVLPSRAAKHKKATSRSSRQKVASSSPPPHESPGPGKRGKTRSSRSRASTRSSSRASAPGSKGGASEGKGQKRKGLHDLINKKHDLQRLAEAGLAGRMMFIFEKVSASKTEDDDMEDD